MAGSDNPLLNYNSPVDALRREGDYLVDFIKLVAYNGEEYDITRIRQELNLYEDIFGTINSGSIVLRDAVDLPQLLPIIGQERIKIRFTRPDIEEGSILPAIDVEFRVYKMSDRQLTKEKQQTYTLYFISEEAIKNLKTKISRAFSGKTYAEIVEKIYKETIRVNKDIIVEPTRYAQKYVAPRKTPFQIFNDVAANALSESAASAPYLFYEDREQFNFVSLEYLLEQEPSEEYIFQVANVFQTGNETSFTKSIETDIRAVENYKFSGSFDIIKNLSRGMYASKLITFDLVRKKIAEHEFDYKSFITEKARLGNHDIHTDDLDALGSPDSSIRLMSTNAEHDSLEWITERESGILPFQFEFSQLQRYSQLEQLNNVKMEIWIPGDPRRKVGQIIEFLLPGVTGDVDKPAEDDRYLTGKFLITALRHRLLQESWFTQLEIVKDSFLSEIAHEDPMARYSPRGDDV